MDNINLLGLINSISMDLNIIKDPNETYNDWIKRIVYSASGRMMLSSLWDFYDSDLVSIQHIKTSSIKVIDAYKECFPFLQNEYQFPDSGELTDFMFELYRNEGYFYHKNNAIRPSEFLQYGNGEICFVKGVFATENSYISGLGTYRKDDGSSIYSCNENNEISQLFKSIVKSAKWYEGKLSRAVQFLKTKPPYTHGYWSDSCDIEKGFTMIKETGEPPVYYFCKRSNDKLFIADLPKWMTNDRQFTYLTVAILKNYNTLPSIKTHFSEHTVDISVGYRLPPLEENTYKLYSWPLHYRNEDINNSFNRICSKEVYEDLKTMFLNIGYNVEEDI